MLPAHHAEFFEGVEDKPGEMLIMVVEVLVVPWTLYWSDVVGVHHLGP